MNKDQFCACRNCNCGALVDTKGIVCGECRDDPRCTGECPQTGPVGDGWYDYPTRKKGIGVVAETDRYWLLFACQRCAEQAVKEEEDHSMKKYLAQLAGPITGMPDLNRRAFMAAAEKVAALGYQVWNPNDWSDLNPDYPNESRPKKFWMRRAIRHLFDADLLVMLPGWVPSDGAMAERVVARAFGMPIVYLFDQPSAYRCEWRR